MSDLSDAIESMRTTMATDSRDWAASKRDAWLYGIVWGWGSAVHEFEAKGWWKPEDTERLRRMHRGIMAARREKGAM